MRLWRCSKKPVRTGGARVGDHVLVTEGIALEGTATLAHDFSDVALRLGLSNRGLAVELAARGVTAMHDVTRGGLLETLMEIAYLAGVGIEVDASRLPVRPVVSRFAFVFPIPGSMQGIS